MLAFNRTIVFCMYTKPKLFNSGRGPFKLYYLSSLIQSCPVSALKHHLANFTQTSRAPLFTIHTPTGFKPVTGHHFTKFLKFCKVNIGLDSTQYSPHSFRRGGATFAFNAGAFPLFIKFLGDWSSDAYMVYLVLNPAQKLSVAKTLAQNTPKAH